ncbi:TPA: SGNH hydrolase domain-containing protein [Legionella anisa]
MHLKNNVYFLDPYEVFCKKGYCISGDRHNHPYYSDGTHLSKIGSRFLISHLKHKIISILNSPTEEIHRVKS